MGDKVVSHQVRNDDFRSLFENAVEGIFQTNLQGEYLRANLALARIYGYKSVQELLTDQPNFHQKLYVEAHAREAFQEEIERKRAVYNFEAQVYRKDGGVIWISETARGVYDEDENLLYYEGFVKEITELKEALLELEKARNAAQAANRAKSAFIANMSHELRSPMNAVLGFSQLMARSPYLTPEHQENIQIIIRSGQHLLTLINNVLDLSKMEAGRVTLEENNFDLFHLLEELHSMFELSAKQKGLQLIFQQSPLIPRYICTDEIKLRQVLINLLSNGIKFTDAGGVSLNVGVEDTDKLTFTVEDSGPGIALEDIERLFQPFVQTEVGKQAKEGTGLGLAISQAFVELMGGEIIVSSQVGEGSTFNFYIKAKLVSEKEIPKPQKIPKVVALETNQPTYRILVVDDKELNRLLLVKLLSPLGFELKEASNGQEAVEIAHDWEPHLIWMDMRMPVMDGYDATKIIKHTLKGQAIAIIALTASILDERRAVILSEGCDDFLRKPFREEEIFQVMAKHLGVRYIYEDNQEDFSLKPGIEEVMTQEAFKALPPQVVNSLAQAIEIADLELVETILKEVETRNGNLAQAIRNCLDNFEYDKVLKFIR